MITVSYPGKIVCSILQDQELGSQRGTVGVYVQSMLFLPAPVISAAHCLVKNAVLCVTRADRKASEARVACALHQSPRNIASLCVYASGCLSWNRKAWNALISTIVQTDRKTAHGECEIGSSRPQRCSAVALISFLVPYGAAVFYG